MKQKYDAVDWQSFSQKKNIEEIVKNTKEKNTIQIAATVEIAMAVLSLISDTIFKQEVPILYSLIVGAISVGTLIYLFLAYAIRFYNKNKPGGDIPDIQSMVNLFDNDICYYVLMAESYSDKMAELNSDKIANVDTITSSNVKQFYFIETCFYINKAIYNLSLTSNCVDELYSTDPQKLYRSRKISYTRLKNIFNILDECIERVSMFNNIISDIDMKANYINLCNEYKKEYKSFKELFLDLDPNVLKKENAKRK